MTAVSTRRDLLTGVTAAAIGAVVPLRAAPATAATDPVLVIAAERDRLRAITDALEERFGAIADANPGPMAGRGWPVVDRSLAIFRRTSFRDGEDIPRWYIERLALIFPEDKAALLEWWDSTYAEMERRAVATGYREAARDLEAAAAAHNEKEIEMADVQATTLAGALRKLETALVVTIGESEPGTYDAMAMGALADLRRLTGKGAP